MGNGIFASKICSCIHTKEFTETSPAPAPLTTIKPRHHSYHQKELICAGDKKVLTTTWQKVRTDADFPREVFRRIFGKLPELKQYFVDSAGDRVSLHGEHFRRFLDSVIDTIAVDEGKAVGMIRKLGLAHASKVGKMTYSQAAFKVFADSTIEGVQVSLEIGEQEKRLRVQQAWRAFTNILVGEMRDAIFKHQVRLARRGTVHLAIN